MNMKQLNTVMMSIGLGLGLTFSVTAIATDSHDVMQNQEAKGISTEQAIQLRQHAFVQIENDAKQAGKALNNKQVDWEGLEQISQGLHESSVSLLSLFPEGSQEGSKAKQKVWSDKVKFERLLKEMDKGFEQLYQATINEDKPSAQQGLKQAQSTCKACHRQYRSRW